jgi:hypothetical protein
MNESDEREDQEIPRAWHGARATVALSVVALGYFGAVWTEAVKSGTSAKWLPAPVAYFTQVAGLFPRAAKVALDYRVEGWRCREKKWEEIDVFPYFPIDADNKENRFYRVFHFYSQDRTTLRALEDFIVDRYNGDVIAAEAAGRGGARIGGIRLTRLTLPFGDPGEGSERFARKPLAAIPEDERKVLYHTPESSREKRCPQIAR